MCKQITLTDQQKKNGAMIIDALNKLGFKNKVVQDAIVMICYKESGFLAKVEWCYSRRDAPGGDVSKLRRLFSTRLARFSDAQILKLLDDCKDLLSSQFDPEDNVVMINKIEILLNEDELTEIRTVK